MTESAPAGVSATPPAPDLAVAGLTALVGQLTKQIEDLLGTVRRQPAEDERLRTQIDALRLEQRALAAGLADLERRVTTIAALQDAARENEAGASESHALTAEGATVPSRTMQADELLERLQERVDELARQDGAIGQAVQVLTERVHLLAQGGATEIVSPSQVFAAAGRTAPMSAAAAGSQAEPFLVTIGSIRTEAEARQLYEAITHLPSVAAIEASPLAAGSLRLTVRLRETWPRSSFTRQMSWLEGLRLSLIFTGPDGLHADLLSSDGLASEGHASAGRAPTGQTSWLRRLVRRRQGRRRPAPSSRQTAVSSAPLDGA